MTDLHSRDRLIGWAVHADGMLTPIVPPESSCGEPIFHDSLRNEMRLVPPDDPPVS
ncbi:hypothetical protein [Kitasatospora sp. NPDC085879]|uniref:hypothetical protein n=1 Tax=Kitasatospora sp. NPDC085879 TaxID=3154769 RepID=UPI0015C6A473|nr:hypothetical protein [Streptomyces sp. TLI_235]